MGDQRLGNRDALLPASRAVASSLDDPDVGDNVSRLSFLGLDKTRSFHARKSPGNCF